MKIYVEISLISIFSLFYFQLWFCHIGCVHWIYQFRSINQSTVCTSRSHCNSVSLRSLYFHVICNASFARLPRLASAARCGLHPPARSSLRHCYKPVDLCRIKYTQGIADVRVKYINPGVGVNHEKMDIFSCSFCQVHRWSSSTSSHQVHRRHIVGGLNVIEYRKYNG